MNNLISNLYIQEVDACRLDFSRDPDFQRYLAQAASLWGGGDMPEPFFRLLDTGGLLSFSHGFRLGLRLACWAEHGA